MSYPVTDPAAVRRWNALLSIKAECPISYSFYMKIRINYKATHDFLPLYQQLGHDPAESEGALRIAIMKLIETVATDNKLYRPPKWEEKRLYCPICGSELTPFLIEASWYCPCCTASDLKGRQNELLEAARVLEESRLDLQSDSTDQCP